MDENSSTAHTAVTYDNCVHVEGPFYHGTKSVLEAGAEPATGYGSDFQRGRVSNHIYLGALVETAAWGAELAAALRDSGERGRIYVVEPLGVFENEPNVTNKRFPGNPTMSYRTRHPLRVLAELETWQGHAPEVLKKHAGPLGTAPGAGTRRHRGLGGHQRDELTERPTAASRTPDFGASDDAARRLYR